MLTLKKRPLLSKPKQSVQESDSEDDDVGRKRSSLPAVSKDFKIPWRKEKQSNGSGDFFVLDTVGGAEEPPPESVPGSSENQISNMDVKESAPVVVDERVQRLLDKAVCGPAFEKNYAETASLNGRRAAKRLRKMEREKTKGRDWFDLPATELTEEAKADLELLQMRSAIDPLAFYRRNDRAVLPKYFQVGRVVDAPEDYYSSRMTKKERKKTMLDELLYDQQFTQSRREKFNAIQEREKKKRRGAFQHSGPRRKRREKTNDKRKKS
ncbi:Fcf2 pre-rRNA processing [Ancylostoma caninum]|uniref:Fcf2 pre-rRNA processing n=1 Tax=Ancylostoma caninum TaxID=29170 RepID=A0A368FY78_ANCCA|nr:Fcf2 pre-rRNA processing [Ancylostoma caninum]